MSSANMAMGAFKIFGDELDEPQFPVAQYLSELRGFLGLRMFEQIHRDGDSLTVLDMQNKKNLGVEAGAWTGEDVSGRGDVLLETLRSW